MRWLLFGSTTTLHAGMSGIAFRLPGVWLPSARVHVAPPSADLKTWPKPLPLDAELKFETVAQTFDGFVGSYSTQEMPPKPLPRGVNDCNHVEFKTLVEVAVVATVVRRIWP